MVGIREFPHELNEAGLQAAAEAAYLAFQINLRRTHDYLPEPAPFSEKETYLRDCYVEMCRAAFGAYHAAVTAADIPMLVPVRWIDREELEKRFPSSGQNLADAHSKNPEAEHG